MFLLRLSAVIITGCSSRLERQNEMAIKDTTIQFGIKIIHDNGPVGWIVGKDGDIMLLSDKTSATAMLKKLKADDRYSWNCEAIITEFTGWGK